MSAWLVLPNRIPSRQILPLMIPFATTSVISKPLLHLTLGHARADRRFVVGCFCGEVLGLWVHAAHHPRRVIATTWVWVQLIDARCPATSSTLHGIPILRIGWDVRTATMLCRGSAWKVFYCFKPRFGKVFYCWVPRVWSCPAAPAFAFTPSRPLPFGRPTKGLGLLCDVHLFFWQSEFFCF